MASGYLIPEAPNHLVHPCALDLMSLRAYPMMPQELQLERHERQHLKWSLAMSISIQMATRIRPQRGADRR